jgi:branched-subunit amino acid transport protein
MNTFQKRLLPLAFGMLMHEGDPAVMRRTLANVPLPARLLMRIIAPRAFSRHARRVYGTATPPMITALSNPTARRFTNASLDEEKSCPLRATL